MDGMLQRAIGFGLVGFGLYLLVSDSVWLGLGVVASGVLVLNGYEHGSWISFEVDLGGGSGGDAGGDGGD
jgi:hypothetical protein